MKLEGLELARANEVDRLKEMHKSIIEDLKREHELDLQHVKNIHQQEIDALKNTHTHTRYVCTCIRMYMHAVLLRIISKQHTKVATVISLV